MSKKGRKPRPARPPRPVQAPRRREQSANGWRRNKTALLLVGAVALAGVAAALASVLGGGGGGDPTTELAAAGCTLRTYRELGRQHVSDLNARVPYNSFPPTSGPHYLQPIVWNSYPAPLSLVQQVHNLEHGGVVIQYGDKVTGSTVERIQSFYASSPNGMLLAPLPRLGSKVALTAWRHLATCTGFDEKAYKAFRNAYRGHGPEPIPVGQLQPGS